MWSLYNKAKTYSKLPSQILRLEDEWTAYQFDNAVNYLGITVENALLERQNVGTEKEPKYEPKYTLEQLLDDKFRLPRPVKEKPTSGIDQLKALVGKGVKLFKV